METANSFLAVMARLLKATGAKNESDFARLLGITPQSITGAKRRGEVPPAWVQAVGLQFGISMDWILFGGGSMRRWDDIPATQEPRTTADTPAQANDRGDDDARRECTELRRECSELRAENRELRQAHREVLQENKELINENAKLQIELQRYKPDKEQYTAEEPTRKRIA